MTTFRFLSSRLGRSLVLSTAAMLFIVSTFFINPNNARMQSGANTIAFDRQDENGTRKVFVMNADGTNVTELANGYDPAFSPDGTKIAYVDGDAETSDIWVMNADGSAPARLTENYQSFSPAWSPDGSKVAFISSHQDGFQIYVISADGTNQQRLEVDIPNIYYKFSPAFSPDGAKIYFVGFAQGESGSTENIYAMNADGSGMPSQLTFDDSTTNIDTLAVAPDGQTIVARFHHDLQAIATSGTGAMVNLTNGNPQIDRHPAFAPNGAKIVFERDDYLHIMNADGSDAVNLDVVGDNPSWNPTAVLPPTGTPTPTPSTPTPTPTVTPTPNDCAQPISIPIEITRSQWRRNDATAQDELILTIRNRSEQSVNPRLAFVFDNLPEGVTLDPSVVDGYTQCAAPLNSPYIIAYAPNKKDWKPMQTVSVRVLFNNPSRDPIPYDWRLYNSTENP
jgi:hypothetical protein